VRVAELFEPRRFHFIDSAAADPGPGEIQVRVRSIGICGSDLHYYAEGAIGDVTIKYPVVLGHEPTGEVWKAGPGVSGVSRGDRAMLEPAVYCYHCEYCRSGHHNVCEKIVFLSTPPDPGFFREYVNLPAHNVIALPDKLSYEAGTLFEPLAVVLHSMTFARVALGETVAVFGAGPIGLLTIAALRASGAGRIWAVEPRSSRRELARVVGADAVIDPGATDPVQEIVRDTGKRGVDVALDCATKSGTIQQAIDSVRALGRVVITGIPSERETPINMHVLRRKEATIHNVRRSNHETDAAVAMLAARPDLFAPLVTHRLPIDDVGRAFDMLETGADGAAKIVLSFAE
jgi:L-iditol 2-dehydrogenase